MRFCASWILSGPLSPEIWSSVPPGRKKKILIARSLCQRAHLYLWDEPLNYIDIYSRTQVEQLILEFAPTMVFVEHDQAFQERIATKKIAVS